MEKTDGFSRVSGRCVWKGSSRRVKKLDWNVHTRVWSLFFCYLLDYSWLGMTENCVYELNPLYVLESVIITVIIIQGLTTHHTAHTQNFFLVRSKQDLDRKTCINVWDILWWENASTFIQTFNVTVEIIRKTNQVCKLPIIISHFSNCFVFHWTLSK